MWSFLLGDSVNGNSSRLVTNTREPHKPGLFTYNEPNTTYENDERFAFNNTLGTELSVNGGFSDTPDLIHDGGDSVGWTASILTGSINDFNFASTLQSQSGTQSVNFTQAEDGDEALFTRSAPVNISDYVALTGYIYITSWNPQIPNKDIQLRFRLAGSDISSIINLSGFVDIEELNVWQKFSIPFSNFGLLGTQLDEFVFEINTGGTGTSPDGFFDQLQLEQTGTPATFTIQPRYDQTLVIDSLTYTIVTSQEDSIYTVAGSTENATVPKLVWNEFFGLNQLDVGLLTRRIQKDNVTFISNRKNIYDFLKNNVTLDTMVSDGTNTLIRLRSDFAAPVVLNGRTRDRYEFIVQDDLSGLVRFSIGSRSKVIKDVAK